MYLTHLNLLSPEKKARQRTIVYIQFARSALEIFLTAISLSAIMLLGAQQLMQEYFNTLAAHLARTSSRYGEANRAIEEVNRILKKTDAIQSVYTLWTPVIADISSAVPESVELSSLVLDAKAKTYTFAGIARTRDDLFALKGNLESLPFVASVNIPPSQYTVKEYIAFSFTVTVR